MTSHIQFYRDQLKQFDADAQAIEDQIEKLQAQLYRLRAARLEFQRMNERVFGEPETTVIMQDMRHRPAITGRGDEPRQIEHTNRDQGRGTDRPMIGEAEREKRRQANRAYYQRQKTKKTVRGEWTQRILGYLKDNSDPATYADIANHFGVRDLHDRERIRGTLNRLKAAGVVVNPPDQLPGRGNRATYLLVRANGAVA